MRMSSVIWIRQEVAEEDIHRPMGEEMCRPMAAECHPGGEGQLVSGSARRLEPDSPSHTYIACRHCRIASGLSIRLHKTPIQPVGRPIACKPRHRIGILQRVSMGPAIP